MSRPMPLRSRPVTGRMIALALCLALLAPAAGAGRARAETPPGESGVEVPGFWDPRRRPERPDLSRLTVIRFLTETDYPPLNFAGSEGNHQGLNGYLERQMCE